MNGGDGLVVVLRCNAGSEIGFGHLTRCRALAQALRRQGERCVMVGPDAAHAKTADQETFEDWIPVSDWSSATEDAARLVDMAHQFGAEWLVLDDYRIDEAYQLSLRAAGLRWLQFDGGAEKALWADVVVNANPAVRPEDYAGMLHNPGTRLLLGPRYAILRPEFERIELRGPGRHVEQILVTFGGGDDRGANEFVLSSLLPVTPPDLQFLVVSGARNPSNPSLKRWIDVHGQGRVSLHIDPEQVAPLFASCDLAVMAGGTSTYEAAACGLPMILVTIAANQVPQSRAWSEMGAAIYLGAMEHVQGSHLASAFQNVMNDHQRRQNMCLAGSQAVQGAGAKYVADFLKEKTRVR